MWPTTQTRKDQLIVSVNIEKGFDVIQYLFMIFKKLIKLRMEGNFFNKIKGIYIKSVTIIIHG